MNQSKSTQPAPPSEALSSLKKDIEKLLGGGNTENSITTN